MNKEEATDKIKNVIVSVLKHGNFEMRDELTASDVDGWSSLTHMMIINDIETEFDIVFKLKELNKLNNIGDLIALVISKVEQK
ncbi:MAG: acyl carrier protein [Bacteroidia bacterium]